MCLYAHVLLCSGEVVLCQTVIYEIGYTFLVTAYRTRTTLVGGPIEPGLGACTVHVDINALDNLRSKTVPTQIQRGTSVRRPQSRLHETEEEEEEEEEEKEEEKNTMIFQ